MDQADDSLQEAVLNSIALMVDPSAAVAAAARLHVSTRASARHNGWSDRPLGRRGAPSARPLEAEHDDNPDAAENQPCEFE